MLQSQESKGRKQALARWGTQHGRMSLWERKTVQLLLSRRLNSSHVTQRFHSEG